MNAATAGLADVRLVRARDGGPIEFPPHSGELVFGFLLEGQARLGEHELGAADAFVIPPDEGWMLSDGSSDLRLLHVTTVRLDAGADCFL